MRDDKMPLKYQILLFLHDYLGAFLATVAIIGIILMLLPRHACAQEVHTSTVDRSLSEIIGGLVDDGFGMSAILNTSIVRLDGSIHALSMGAGLGISHKWNASKLRYPLELGLYLAPTLQVDGHDQHGAFALLMHCALIKGFGLGLGYDVLQIGGLDPGWHAPHTDRVYGFIGYNLGSK